MHSPKFVVLDEPTNGLDPNQILEIRKLVKEIAVDHVSCFPRIFYRKFKQCVMILK